MILYGSMLTWGAMVTSGDKRGIVAVFFNKESAQSFCDVAKDRWIGKFSPILLNEFEEKYCEPINHNARKKSTGGKYE